MKTKPTIKLAVIIAFLAPYIAVASGGAAAWLFVHLNIFSTFGFGKNVVAHVIASVIVFAVTSALTYAAAHFHWLPVVITKLTRPVAGAGVPPAGPTGAV